MKRVEPQQMPERIKILYLIGTLRIGGAERQIVEVATRLDREHFDPRLYSISAGGPLETILRQHALEYTAFDAVAGKSPIPAGVYGRKLFALLRYMQRERPMILHSYMHTPSIYGRICAVLTRVPVVITSRRSLEKFKDRQPYYHLLERVLNRYSTQILVNSEAVRQQVLRHERRSASKLQVVYNGVDTQRYTPITGPLELFPHLLHQKQNWGIPESAPVIGMVANLHLYKGYQDFLLAAANVHQQFPSAYFVCVGEDRKILPELETLSRELGIREHVVFAGRLTNIPEVLQVFDIQVSASHQEGFSNAILEGMATGNPIVATAVGGTPEAIEDGVCGILIPPYQPEALACAILRLLRNRELAEQLGQHARQRVEARFSMPKMMMTLEALYSSLYAQYHGQSPLSSS